MNLCRIQNKIIFGQEVYTCIILENHIYILPLKELFVEQHIFLEENIEVYEEVHEDLIIKEELKKKNLNQDCGED